MFFLPIQIIENAFFRRNVDKRLDDGLSKGMPLRPLDVLDFHR